MQASRRAGSSYGDNFSGRDGLVWSGTFAGLAGVGRRQARHALRLPVRQGIGRMLMGRPSRGLAIGAYA